MADEILEIGTRVDTGAIVSGMAGASSAVQQSTQQMSLAFQTVASTSSAAMGSIAQTSTPAVAAVQSVTNAVKTLNTASTRAASVGIPALRYSMQQVAVASHGAVSGVQATSAAIRSLEGNAGLRAVENFISKTLGLGPAMQAIFPIVGGLAFGKILFDIVESVVQIGIKASRSGEMIQTAFSELHEKASVTNDDLRITSDRLQIEIDKLQGHPSNGVYLALDEARKMGDQLAVSLRADRKALDDLLKENSVSQFGQALTNVAATGKQRTEMLQDQKELTDAVHAANRTFQQATGDTTDANAIKAAGDVRDNAIRAAYQKQIDSYDREAKRLVSEQANSQMLANAGVRTDVTDNSTKINAIEGRKQQLVDALADENQGITNAQRQATKGQLEQQKEDAENAKRAAAEAKAAQREATAAARQAAQEKLREIETHISELKLAGGLTLAAEEGLWQQAAMGFSQGSEQYRTIVAREAALSAEAVRKAHELIEKLKKEETASEGEGSKALIEGQRTMERWTAQNNANLARSGPTWDAYWREVAKGQEIATGVGEQMALLAVQTDLANGFITQKTALDREAAIHTKEHADKVAELRAELAKLQQQVSLNALGNVNDPKLAAQMQGVQNQIDQEQGSGKAQGAQDQNAIAQQKARPYQMATQQISQGLSGALASWERGQGTFLQAWGKTLGSMAIGLQQTLVQMGAKWVEHYALQRILHIQTAAQKAATDTAAKATQATTTAATNTAGILSEAAVAGAAAFASTAAIPIVGPLLAPEAGAAAYASVAAMAPLASAQGGWDMVPADNTLANLHKNEMVLPAHLADGIRGITGKGGPSQITNHFGGNTINGGGGDFPSLLDKHEDALAYKVSSLMRDRHPAFGG